MKINLKGKSCVMVGNKVNGRVTRKTLFGKPHIIVEGCGSIVGNSVMNGRLYPLEEIAKIPDSTPQWIFAPFGHPSDENGSFVPASHPLAVTQNYGGVWSGNYRMDGDLLIRDIAINIEVAEKTEQGRELLRRIDAGEDVDTSTGLLFIPVEGDGYAADGEPYGCTVTNIMLDHDAILLNEQGAATSNEGVGIFANSSDEGAETADVEFATQVNASAPAGRMELHAGDYDEPGAIERIKKFTGSTDKPSRNYRKFFLQFDRNNADSFDAYKMPFADVQNGRPVASASQLRKYAEDASLDAQAKAVVKNYLSSASNSDDDKDEKSLFNRLLAKVMNAIAPIEKIDYSDSVESNNQPEGDPMKDKILAALNAAGVKTEGLNDDQLFEAYNALATKQQAPAKNSAEDIATAINTALAAQLKPLQDKLTSLETAANASKETELNDLASQVEKLDIGLNAATAKALGVDGMKSLIAKNSGVVNFNSVTNAQFDKNLLGDLPE